MAEDLHLEPHPRLYLGDHEIARLKYPANNDLLKAAEDTVAKDADQFLSSTTVPFDETTHNSLLVRARNMQGRIFTLLVRWKQTGEERYRKAAIDHVREMGRWEFWSWTSWRNNNRDPDADFDLSYGENAATLAVAYDWVQPTLTAQEKIEFLDIARKWVVQPYLKFTHASGKRPFWFAHPNSNWNTVCCGGAGMLALAMTEDLPEAPRMLAATEESIVPFMKTLERTNGGWQEGLGYWNYGMRYAFMYLLSWEHATGRKHPLMQQNATLDTIHFPLDFTPNGVTCSFGDVPRWNPLPFHFAVAERLGAYDVLAALDTYMTDWKDRDVHGWLEAPDLLLLYPRTKLTADVSVQQNVAKIYPELEWGILADRLPAPNIYMAVRSGTTKVPHAQLDLLSFFAVLGNETMIANLGNAEYLDTTFSNRRWEILEMTPAVKNTILINGVGITVDSSATSTVVGGKNWKGIRIDATDAMGKARGEKPSATFCGRLFIILPVGDAFLILDRIELPHPGRVEIRMHTRQKTDFAQANVLIKAATHQLRATFASDVPCVLKRSEPGLTNPAEPNPTQIRWCTAARSHTTVTMATLLTPGADPAIVTVAPDAQSLHIKITAKTWNQELRVDSKLRPPKPFFK